MKAMRTNSTNDAVQEFLSRIQADPHLGHAYLAAPGPTVRGLSGMSGADRQALLGVDLSNQVRGAIQGGGGTVRRVSPKGFLHTAVSGARRTSAKGSCGCGTIRAGCACRSEVRPETLDRLAANLQADPMLRFALEAAPRQTLKRLRYVSSEEVNQLAATRVVDVVHAHTNRGRQSYAPVMGSSQLVKRRQLPPGVTEYPGSNLPIPPVRPGHFWGAVNIATICMECAAAYQSDVMAGVYACNADYFGCLQDHANNNFCALPMVDQFAYVALCNGISFTPCLGKFWNDYLPTCYGALDAPELVVADCLGFVPNFPPPVLCAK
jgi:hypothetical protein